MAFVHLHNHSHYSLLDGLSKISDMVAKAKKIGLTALALTDHGNLYGAIEFYKECRAAGIKPIIGVEAYLAKRSRFDKESNIDNRRYHLTLLASNLAGYKNLLKLVTAANLEGYYYKPRMDKDLLRQHREGIICLSGCLASELSRTIVNQGYDAARVVALEYQNLFGAENYFLEIMYHPKIERQTEVTEGIIKLAHELKIPLVATQDAHYLDPSDAKAHDTLVAIQTNTDIEDTKRFSNQNEDFSFIDPATAERYFAAAPEAVSNTALVAERCQLELELGRWVFPEFPLPAGTTPADELTRLTRQRLEDYQTRSHERANEAETRANYELGVITKKGYAPYFLVVADIINYAREHGIFTNTRGSAAGSLVSFLLGITNVDPLVYKLPFERFLNADRPSPPDIDMDFADRRRDEVLDYVRQKYGTDHVAQIGTFGSMLARGAVRDVARALGHPYGVGDKISNLIPLGSQGFPMTIERALKATPELKTLYDGDSSTKQIIDLARKIEGCARHISVHAAGVVIAPTPLTDFVPLQYDPKGGKIITQYDMHAVEDAGLLKFDFLGIRNLSILENAIRIIAETSQQKIDIENIPIEDKKTFAMLARGETTGLFQLNGTGMTRWLKELRPTNIYDINAMVALYRPGPMESIPEYIKRKHKPSLIKYLDPRLKEILDQSYGVITYQDDVMMIAIKLAGYSLTEADKLRKAMGKKIPKEMAAQKEGLVKGLVANGLDKKKAEELWQLIEPFAAYGFNKAHAASYGRVAYQTSYLKANYPSEYMTAVLSAESGDVEEISNVISECKKMSLPVLPPDINESVGDFTVVKDPAGDKVRFGLYTIKNLGEEIANVIVAERHARGHFRSFADLLERVTHKNLNKKSLEALIKAGTVDSLGEERGQLLANLDELLEYHREVSKQDHSQVSLFGTLTVVATAPLKLKASPPASMEEKLAWEKELLGLYLSGHPLDRFREKFAQAKEQIKAAKAAREGTLAIVAGVIEEAKVINTRKGERMAFVRLADFNDKIEVVVFSRLFDQFKPLLESERCVAIRGRVSFRNGEPSIVADSLKELA